VANHISSCKPQITLHHISRSLRISILSFFVVKIAPHSVACRLRTTLWVARRSDSVGRTTLWVASRSASGGIYPPE